MQTLTPPLLNVKVVEMTVGKLPFRNVHMTARPDLFYKSRRIKYLQTCPQWTQMKNNAAQQMHGLRKIAKQSN
jgi:hypothetical protein